MTNNNSLNNPENSNWQDIIKNNIIWVAGGILLSGFGTGFGAGIYFQKTQDAGIILAKDQEIARLKNQLDPIDRLEHLKLELNIESPSDGDLVDGKASVDGKEVPVPVRGTLVNSLPTGVELWLIVKPHNDKGISGYYPQTDSPIIVRDKKWEKEAIFGDENDKGRKFDLIIIAANQTASAYFRKQISDCRKEYKCYQDPPLPESGVRPMKSITVIRK